MPQPSSEANALWLAQLLVGAFIVAVYCYSRFSNPRHERYTTTLSRYVLANVLYIGLGLSLYMGLVVSPELLNVLASAFREGTQESLQPVVDWIRAFSPPLLAALIVTVFIPMLPKAARIDAYIRNQFRRIALIPKAARVLSGQLARARYSVPEDLRTTVDDELAVLGHWRGADRAFPALQAAVTQVLSLKEQVDDWRRSGFADFMDNQDIDYQRICRRCDAVMTTLRIYLGDSEDFERIERRLKESAANTVGGGVAAVGAQHDPEADEVLESYRRLVAQYETAITKELSGLKENLCDFVAKGVLSAFGTEAGRKRYLNQMGFSYEAPKPFPWELLMLIGLLLLLGLFLVISLAEDLGLLGSGVLVRDIMLPADLAEASGRAVVSADIRFIPPIIILSHCLATMWALLLHAEAGDELAPGGAWRVRGEYFLAGLLSAVTALAVIYVGWALMLGSPSLAAALLLYFSPVAALPATTGLVTAFNLSHHSRREFRIAAPFVHVVALWIVSYVVSNLWLGQVFAETAAEEPAVFGVSLFMVATTTMIGLVVGGLVPTFYHRRRELEEAAKRRAPEPTAVQPLPGT